MTLFDMLVRSLIEYGSITCYPYTKRDTRRVVRVQNIFLFVFISIEHPKHNKL